MSEVPNDTRGNGNLPGIIRGGGKARKFDTDGVSIGVDRVPSRECPGNTLGSLLPILSQD